ncbi:Uncharacterized protein TPAR_02368 [Tolypocladium paradoxum]|uniref:Xylanolytic transcriptional activator regulatory domain-containing protein n=1 Tax=Tolypocladium paradoxum TaxID=94208 RepID=A0A2S4L4R1_9HYPO|nr:Uncharacterized protein TPAR_02368 [Tolypocladium paradoxum]
MESAPSHAAPRKIRKQRIPLKCDAQHPCSRPLGESIMGVHLNAASLPPTLAANDPKQKGLQVEIDNAQEPDFITAGLLTTEQAEANFGVFFQGCGHYFPFLDPKHDSIQRLRNRSILLFNTICAVGCRARIGPQSQFWRILDTHVSRMHDILTTTGEPSIETIQALLIRACYSSERSLLISMATRMALELGLPEAYTDLSNQIILGRLRTGLESLECDRLLQRTRTWLSILVLRLMLGIDTGKSLDFNLYGDVRRYLILLDKPFSTELDLCLLEQVELNVLRAGMYKSITEGLDANDEGLMNAVRDARIGTEVWFNDWTHIFECSTPGELVEDQSRVHACNGSYIDAMSPARTDILLMAKNALHQHLQATIAEPRLYIHNLRYATDYVWAKFVFCFLLLLDLSTLVSDDEDAQKSKLRLLPHGNALLRELADAGGIITGETCSYKSRDYLQILQNGVKDYARSISGILNAQPSTGSEEWSSPREMSLELSERSNGKTFVPEQFVFEWKFPHPWLREMWQA